MDCGYADDLHAYGRGSREAQPKPKGDGKKKILTPEEAEAKLLAELETVGAEGTQVPSSKPKGMPVAVYEEALERLERGGFGGSRGERNRNFSCGFTVRKCQTAGRGSREDRGGRELPAPARFRSKGLLKAAQLDKDEKALGAEAVEQLRGRRNWPRSSLPRPRRRHARSHVAVEKLGGARGTCFFHLDIGDGRL